MKSVDRQHKVDISVTKQSYTFSQMVQGIFEGNFEQTRKDLLAYCELDTLAMVRILEVLKRV